MELHDNSSTFQNRCLPQTNLLNGIAKKLLPPELFVSFPANESFKLLSHALLPK
jgi:hypothetical protein